MVDSIGKMPVGRSAMTGRKRKDIKRKTTQKMEQWRDKARINIIEQRRRYKAKVERNERQTAEKKESWEKSLNPSAFSLMPKSRNRISVTHSTMPLRPRYSKVKPKERIYGDRWKKLEEPRPRYSKVKPKISVKKKIIISEKELINGKNWRKNARQSKS